MTMPAKRGSAAPLPRNIRERKLPDGSGSFTLDFRDQHGQRVREAASAYCDAISRKVALKTAERLLARRRTEIAAGSFLSERQKAAAERSTEAARAAERGPLFREFAADFLRDYSAHATRSCFHRDRVKALTKHFGEMRLREITAADVDAFLRDRSKLVKASTVLRDAAVLRKMFKQARRWKKITVLPTDDMALPKEPGHKTRWLTRDEFERFREAAPPWLRPILTISVATGMRLKETVSLRWEDVDDTAGLLYVTPEGKTGKGRVVPQSEAARAVIEKLPKRLPRSAFIFTDSAGEPLVSERARHRITQAARDAAERAGLEGVSFHTLRHTAASWMVQWGVPLNTVREVLGHQSFAMTLRYAHLAPDHLAGSAAALDAALGVASGRETDSSQQSGIAGAPGDRVSA
jgi:integrase